MKGELTMQREFKRGVHCGGTYKAGFSRGGAGGGGI